MSNINDYKPGMIVYGRVSGIKPYGAFVKFDDGVTGLIHISEISNGFVKNIDNFIKLDSYILSKVIDVDNVSKQLRLSYKALNNNNKRKTYKAYHVPMPEEEKGFKTIQENMDKWINDYLKK